MKFAMIVAVLLPLVSVAQETSIPKPVVDSIAKDLADIQAAVLAGQARMGASQPTAALGTLEAVTVTGAQTTVRLGAAESAKSIFTPKPGQTFQVIDKTPDWYAIKLDKAISGFTTGWVNASDVVPTYRVNSSGMVATAGGMHASVGTAGATDASVGSSAGATDAWVGVSVTEAVYRDLTEKAARMRARYADNPHVSVSGFTVNVGWPPSVGINFEFKK